MPLADPVLLGCLSSSPPPTTLHPDWDAIVSLFVCGLRLLFESTDANDVMKTFDHPGNGSGFDVTLCRSRLTLQCMTFCF